MKIRLIALLLLPSVIGTHGVAQTTNNPPININRVQGDELTAPPSLPALPQDAPWDASTKKAIEKGLNNYAADQVSAFVTFRDLIRKPVDKKDKTAPTANQRKWLQDAVAVLKPRVVEILNRDINLARGTQDFRGAFIASLALLTASESDEAGPFDDFISSLPKVTDLMKQSFAAKDTISDVWQITEPTGEFMSSYTEGFYPSMTIVTPDKEEFRILRVRAKIKNVSSVSDQPYVAAALNYFKRLSLFDDRDDIKKPTRLAGDTFIYVVNPEYTKSFPIGYITANENSVLRNGVLSFLGFLLSSGGKTEQVRLTGKALQKVNPGSFVEQGKEFDIDVLFPVPKGSGEFRFVIIGSRPVSIKINPAQ